MVNGQILEMIMFSKLRAAKNVIMIKIRLIVQCFCPYKSTVFGVNKSDIFREEVLIQGFFFGGGGGGGGNESFKKIVI